MDVDTEKNALGTHVDIDLSAIAYNIRAVQKLLSPRIKIMTVIKGDAYGHDSIPTAEMVVEDGIDRIGVPPTLDLTIQ